MSYSRDSGLDQARSMLRAEQRRTANAGFAALNTPVTEAALERYEEYTGCAPDEGSDRVRRGPFTYDSELESKRIARGEALIRRVEPGPFEDANYFAMIAYQAASIEMAYADLPLVPQQDPTAKFLLGTAHQPEVNAFSSILATDNYTIVVLNSGLVDLIYQAAKGVIEAANPKRSSDPQYLVSAVYDLDAVRTGLVSNPEPAERLYRTLEAYFFKGYPRATAFETVPEEQHPPLALLISMAERWVIGHEYGHGMAPWRPKVPLGPGVSVEKAEEYSADLMGMIWTVWSAHKWDAVTPEIPLAGAIFALACLELCGRALTALLRGDDQAIEGETHPASRDRANGIIRYFRQFFDVEFDASGQRGELWFRADRREAPETGGLSKERINDAYFFANVLWTVWRPVRDRLLEDFRQRRPLHPMWR